MKTSHAGLAISGAEWDANMKHADAVLIEDSLGIGAELEAQKARMAEVMAAMQALAAAGNDPEKREAAMERVRAGGGQVVHGPMPVPGDAWIAQCTDPQGAFFCMVSVTK